MKVYSRFLFLVLAMVIVLPSLYGAEFKTPGDRMFAAYFKAETDRLAAGCLKDVKTLDDWNKRKDKFRSQMHEMLGLDPMPPRTPLKVTVTGKVQHKDFEVWKVHYQSI